MKVLRRMPQGARRRDSTGAKFCLRQFELNQTASGNHRGTATFVGAKSGTYSWCSQAYLDDGEVVTGAGPGAYESVGKHRWRTQGSVQISAGRTVPTEGEIDLATRPWTGKIFAQT